MDLGTDNPEELKKITSQIELDIEKEPPKSTLCICNVKDATTRLRPEIIQILKDFTKHNEPYMKMTAVIGVEGLKQIIFNSFLAFSRRKNLVLKNSEEEALEWLIKQ